MNIIKEEIFKEIDADFGELIDESKSISEEKESTIIEEKKNQPSLKENFLTIFLK